MTESDTVELAAICAANSMTAFTIYISFTFGFLATAFFVGSRLTRFQVFAATGMYLVAAVSMGLTSLVWLQATFAAKDGNTTFLDTIPFMNGNVWVSGITIILVLGIFVSLSFMWAVRHPKTE